MMSIFSAIASGLRTPFSSETTSNDRSTEEKRTVGIACACQNGYVRKSEPKLIGT